MMPTNR